LTDSLLGSIRSSRASTQDDATIIAKTSTAYAFPTRRGGANTTTANPVDCPSDCRRQTAPIRRNRYYSGSLLAQHNMVPIPPTTRSLYHALPAFARPLPAACSASPRVSDHPLGASWSFKYRTSAWLYTRRGAIGRSPRAAHAAVTAPPPSVLRPVPSTHHLTADPTQAPLSSCMTTKFRTLMSTDSAGTTAIGLLSSSLAPSTYANYDNTLRHYFAFCAEEHLPPLQATPSTMVRYATWLGLFGTVVAGSLQPCFSSVNEYFRDHKLSPLVT
jgi:hypothetical protein